MQAKAGSDQRLEDDLDAVMEGAAAFMGMIVALAEPMDPRVSLRQIRALAIVSAAGPMSLVALAERLRSSPSSVTRLCDRLVESGLLNRRQSATDRRYVSLTTTVDGQRLVDSLLTRRREHLGDVLRHMPAISRRQMAESLRMFAAAAQESGREVAPASG